MRDGKFQNSFRKLIVWREAHKLTIIIYRFTKAFPKDEQYGITSQLRRASSSVGAQIAEGSRMSSIVHRKLFYERAYASLAEVDNFLELAHDLGLFTSEIYEELLGQVNRVSALLRGLIKSCFRERRTPA